jgi:hypothetical protein
MAEKSAVNDDAVTEPAAGDEELPLELELEFAVVFFELPQATIVRTDPTTMAIETDLLSETCMCSPCAHVTTRPAYIARRASCRSR